MALSGDIDVLPSISKTGERSLLFLFSEPYYFSKRVIVTRDDENDISDIQDLERQTVAVQRNSSHHSYLTSVPKINLSLYDSAEAALVAVENGSERFAVGNIDSTNYLINSTGLTNLKYVAFEAEKQQALYFAVNKDLPELVNIFNKALHSITDEEKITIGNKWINPGQETDYSSIIAFFYVIGVLAAVVMAVSFYWIALLRKEIKKRELIQIDLEDAKLAADEANKYKSDFMARMSHEIRTPLNAITGMAYLLKDTKLTSIQRMYTDRITMASSTMLNIINDILDFSKIEAGKTELEVTSFSMDEIIQNVVNIVSYKIEEQRIEFKLSKDPELPNWFFGDPKRIEQILLNVLNNAVKFTDLGFVSLGIQVIEKENEKYHISFIIRDSGIGMNEKQLKNLFEPFTQADVSINRRFGGSGLGLSIVKSLVELMGGRIQVFSSLNEGTRFMIYISLTMDTEKENVIRDRMAISIRPEEKEEIIQTNLDKNHSVLVVEDNKTNQVITESLLQKAGLTSIFANNGKAAIDIYKKHKNKIDLILMDLHMPLMNGYQAAQEIRKISDSVPIVAMTADVIEGVKVKCEESGIYHYISKPFDPEYFIQTIRSIVNSHTLDIPAGLRNMCDDMETYRQILEEYFKENKDTTYKLIQAVSKKRYAEAAQIVHKVKSSSGSIGATEFYNLSIEFQSVLEGGNEDEVSLLHKEYSAALKKLLDEINEFLS